MIRLVTVASVISTYQKPAITVDTNDDAQTALWASRLNVSRDRLLAAADTALYRAKRDGRNRVQVAEEEPLPPEQDRRRPAVWPAPAVRQSSVMWPV
jgi:hypothetical protein